MAQSTVTISTPDQAYVASLYTSLLERAPDPGGVTFYAQALTSGQLTRAQVYQSFLSSPEYAAVFVTQLYRTLLGRAPDAAGFAANVNALVSGRATRDALYAEVLGSAEYRQKQNVPQVALQRLVDPATEYSVVGSDFTGLTARTLGNAGTGADGFDSLIALPLNSFNADVSTLAELDTALVTMDFVEGLFDHWNYNPVAGSIAIYLDGGDSLLSGFAALLG
jgi:hypothetical protein